MLPPPPLKPDSASQANFQALSTQLGDSCSAPILEPERSALLQEALADPHLQAVKAQLERRGLGMNVDEAQAVQLVGGVQLLIPFGQDAHLVWTRTTGQTAAVGLIRQGNKTLNIGADGQERVVKFLSAQQTEKLLRKLRERSKFQEFEGKLAQKGKRVGKVRVLFDETNKIAILGIASEGNEEKISHQVRIKVKANKEDEPEDDAEPVIQATACGQASGEAVALGARMQPLLLDPGEGGDVTTGSYDIPEGRDYGTNICTSQWGYAYNCIATTPSVSLSTTSLALPQTFINQQVQGSFVIWNYGGGRLTGTVSVSAPFSIVSGASFSLLPGQPQEVVVRFSSGTAGSFSRSISISSNGGNATVTATAVAHKVSFSPAQVNFGEGLFVVTQQCGGETGECMPYTKKVGLPLQGKLIVKNEGSVAVSLNLSTSAPFYLPNGGSLTVAAGQSVEVAVRFDPADSGAFTGVVQVGLQGGQGSLTSGPLTGTAHKIEVSPLALNFFALVEGPAIQQALTIKNQGMTELSLIVRAAEPFSVDPSSFTLAAGESKDVTVQFSPPTSGEFSSAISIKASQMQTAFTVPVKGRGITEAEFYQWLSNMSQTGPIDAVIPTDDVSVALWNFRDLTPTAIQALVDLAKTEQWDSLAPVVEPDQWSQLIKLIQLIYGFLTRDKGQAKQNVLDALEELANALKSGFFRAKYEGLQNDKDFGAFIGVLKDIIRELGATSHFGSATSEEAAEQAIKAFCQLYNDGDDMHKEALRTIFLNFGPGAVFAFAALAKIDPNVAGDGIMRNFFDGFAIILMTQANGDSWGYKWYDVNVDNTLWKSLNYVLLILGQAAAHREDPKLQEEFNTIIATIGVAANMAANGWFIFALRAQGTYAGNGVTLDLVGGYSAEGRAGSLNIVVFGQFFHAFKGFSWTDLKALVDAVRELAKGSDNGLGFLRSLFPGIPNNTAFQSIKNAGAFGIIIAVKQQDSQEAEGIIDQGFGADYCGGKCFAIIIVVNDNQVVTDIVIKGSIDPEIAKQILSQIGIAIGSKMPESPRLRYVMMMLMWSLGLVQ